MDSTGPSVRAAALPAAPCSGYGYWNELYSFRPNVTVAAATKNAALYPNG